MLYFVFTCIVIIYVSKPSNKPIAFSPKQNKFAYMHEN